MSSPEDKEMEEGSLSPNLTFKRRSKRRRRGKREVMSSSEEEDEEKEIRIGDNNGNENHRNWCSDLPMDVLLLIMSKVGAIYILMGAQWVCKNWRKVCREVPSLWRSIDMTALGDDNDTIDLNRMAREAIDRASGDIQQFAIRYNLADDELLRYLADSTILLRCLRVIAPYGITEEGLAESVGRFPLLEELDITFDSYCFYDYQVFELVGKACPHLKCFRYNQVGSKASRLCDYEEGNEEALGIANYMPDLRQLQIVGNMLSNAGLMAILDKCVHLESLDLRCCFRINMDATLTAKCARIKDLRLTNDSLDDYLFQAVDGVDETGYRGDGIMRTLVDETVYRDDGLMRTLNYYDRITRALNYYEDLEHSGNYEIDMMYDGMFF